MSDAYDERSCLIKIWYFAFSRCNWSKKNASSQQDQNNFVFRESDYRVMILKSWGITAEAALKSQKDTLS